MGQIKKHYENVTVSSWDSPNLAGPASTPDLGIRHNAGKIRPTLLSPYALQGLLDVLEFGAKKYAPRNWEKGLPGGNEAILDSLLRHVLAMMRGEVTDPESGLPHIDHVQCNAMFISHFHHLQQGEEKK